MGNGFVLVLIGINLDLYETVADENGNLNNVLVSNVETLVTEPSLESPVIVESSTEQITTPKDPNVDGVHDLKSDTSALTLETEGPATVLPVKDQKLNKKKKFSWKKLFKFGKA